jgi:hypothetical protein
MANISFFTRMTADLIVEQKSFLGWDAGWAFEMLMILSLFLIGFAYAGFTRSALIYPHNIVWPQLLSTTALNAVLHRGGLSTGHPQSKKTWQISGYAFFCIVFLGSLCWYWLPDFAFPALGYFGGFPGWIQPDNVMLNQIFGVSSGIGLLPLTLDCKSTALLRRTLLTCKKARKDL